MHLNTTGKYGKCTILAFNLFRLAPFWYQLLNREAVFFMKLLFPSILFGIVCATFSWILNIRCSNSVWQ